MRINRIYQSLDFQVGQTIELDKAASQHLNKVLRLKINDPIELFNDDGFCYSANIISINRNQVSVHIIDKALYNNESPLNIHLFQGISRGDKMDLTLQKGVELGVNSFTPVITERCGVKLDQKRWQKKQQHWQKVIISACEQSGRNRLPTLNSVLDWNQALNRFNVHAYFLDPHAKVSFRDLAQPNLTQEIQLWVGPEGGFSPNETQQIEQLKGIPVYLGPRVLRTETAALAAISSINALWGDF